MATTVAAPAPDQEPAKIGAVGRMIGMLFSPKATFEDIVRKPSWLAPLLLMVVLVSGLGYMLGQKVDWAGFIRHQSEASPAFTALSQDQQDQRVTVGAKIAPIFADCSGVFIPIGLLIVTLIYWLAFNLITGSGLRFSVPWAIACFSQVPAMLGSILGIVVVGLKPAGTVSPERFLASTLAAYLSPDAPHWLVVLGTSVDIFFIWTMILVATGFSVANPRKISKGSAYGIVFGLWILYVAVRVGIAAM
jgi:hypothetical protein